MKSKNEKILNEFVEYCNQHPEFRFWQALKNFMNAYAIFIQTEGSDDNFENEILKDTFYYE